MKFIIVTAKPGKFYDRIGSKIYRPKILWLQRMNMSKNERKKYEHLYKAQKVNKDPKIYIILSAYLTKRRTVMQICNLHDCFFYTLITGT